MIYEERLLFCRLLLQCCIQIGKRTRKEKICFLTAGKEGREAWRRTLFKHSERKWNVIWVPRPPANLRAAELL